MELCSIASGSSGNCIYVGNDDTHLMIDAGISGRRIEEGLNQIGLKTSDMSGILVTHEHTDHIGGLGVVARKYGIPIYATGGTIDAIKRSPGTGQISDYLFHEVKPDKRFKVGGMEINPIKVSHDAAEPVAYRFFENGRSAAVMTDLGKFDDYIVDSLKDCNAILLEANHDVNMLQVGPYPYMLKQRILGDKGHLSNDSCGRLLVKLLNDGLEHIILGHLSKENNLAELAFETVRMEITLSSTEYKFSDFPVTVAKRSERTELVTV